MKQRLTTLCLFALACSAFGAGAFDPFAQRVPCEVDQDTKAQAAELRTLRWLQGTTPLIQLDAINSGRQASGTGTVARMLIGPTGTGTYYAVATNYTATNGSFLVQWPTVGTNSGTNVWWYTVYFERSGKRYWTGSGKLTIAATTSTEEDGLLWQTNTTSYQLGLHNTSTNAHPDIRALIGTGSSGADYTARSSTVINASATLAVSSRVDSLTIEVASLPTSNNVFEVWREMAATSSVVNAQNAMNLVSPDGWIAMRMSNGVLWVTEVTNTTSLSVVHVSGDGYNGPVLGTAFVGPPILLDGGPYWKWANDDFNFISDSDEDHPGEIPTKLFGTSVDTALDPDGMWIVNPGTFTLNAFSGIAVGSFTVDWLKSTNTYTIGGGVTNINGKSGAVIVLTAADVGALAPTSPLSMFPMWAQGPTNSANTTATNVAVYIGPASGQLVTNGVLGFTW